MFKGETITCYIAGQDSLVIHCAEILLSRGHTILGVISSFPAIQTWASEKHIFCAESLVCLQLEKLSPCDYIFSIINPDIFPSWLLNFPKHFCINYHDALLPRGAGVHATSWAIFNQEKTHGITWHVMEEGLDTGDILKQAVVPIAEDETALSLNLKCYERAIETFSVLVDDLSQNQYQRLPQDLTQRTYYALHRKLPGNGWIDWHNEAALIDRTYRALQLGDYPNALGTAKFQIGDAFYLIGKLQRTRATSIYPAGTLVDITKTHWRIATATQDVLLLQIKALSGEALDLQALANHHHLHYGSLLPSPPQHLSETSEKLSTLYSPSEKFWVRAFQDFHFTEFPYLYSHALPKEKVAFMRLCEYEVSDECIQVIKKAWGADVDFSTTWLALWFVYLHRTTDKEHLGISFHYPALKQSDVELNHLFSNEIPLSVDIEGSENFQQVLSKINAHITTLQKQQTYLIDIFSRHPVLSDKYFPTLMSVWVLDDENLKLSAIHSEALFVLVILKGGKKLSYCMNASVLKEHAFLLPCFENIASTIDTLLHAVLDDKETAVKNLPLLSASEYQKMVHEWGRLKTNYPRDKTLHELFELQVAQTPDRIAVVQQSRTLTYLELNQRVNQLARHLRQQGVVPGTCVGIYMFRSIEMIVAMLSIMKAGGIYVPVDMAYPPQRVQLIFEETKAKIILTTSHESQHLNTIDLKDTIFILLDSPELAVELAHKKISLENLICTVNAESSVYIMYTSGSTGQPKGIEIIHRGVVRLVKQTNYFDVRSDDCVACISNPAFDAATFEIWGALLNGMRLVIFSVDEALDPVQLLAGFKKNNVTIAMFAALLFDQLLKQAPRFYEDLRIVYFGGEAPTVHMMETLQHLKKTKCKLLNAYGPSENTCITTFYDAARFHGQYPRLPIGSSIANTEVYVLNQKQQLLPVGVIGELCVGGDGLAKCYKNRPDLTAKHFIPNPYQAGERLYKTGDLVRWLADGNLDLIGRVDHQIKIRGFRMELSEIETHLQQYHSILEVKVLLRCHQKNQKELIAFFVQKKISVPVDIQSIRSFLKDRLPEYMWPKYFCEVFDFPLNASGKIDSAALMQYFESQFSEIAKPAFKPKTKKQKILSGLFNEIFDREVDGDEDFFSLGGDSILAMQLVSKARSRQIFLKVSQVFQYPTVLQLAEQAIWLNTKKINKKEALGSIALTPIQTWFFNRKFFKNNKLSQVCLIDVNYLQSIEKLHDFLCHLLMRYDAFRLSFIQNENAIAQVYVDTKPNISQLIERIEFSSMTSSQWDLFLDDLIEKAQAGFKLEEGWLVKFYILKNTQKNQFKLLSIAHHLIVDGVSWRILFSDLEKLSQLDRDGRALCLPPIAARFKDWSKAIQHYAADKKHALLKSYWLNILKTNYAIPLDYPEGDNTKKNRVVFKRVLSQDETAFLIHFLTKQYDATMQELILLCVVRALSEWSNAKEIVLDLESHGRADVLNVDVSHTFGWFTSLFPMAFSSDFSATMAECIQCIKERLSAVPNNGIDYGVLRYVLNDSDIQKYPETQQVSFNYWGQFDQIFSKEGVFHFEWLKFALGKEHTRTHLLDIEAMILDGELNLYWTYSKQLHQKKTIEWLAKKSVFYIRELINSYVKKRDGISLGQEDLDSLSAVSSASYPLTPMQKGLLFHAISSPGSEAYTVQFSWKLHPDIEIEILKKAFQSLINRHPILRTIFKWSGLKEPLQVVQNKVVLSWREYDWRDTNTSLDSFLKADRQAGFVLDQGELFRVTLIQQTEQQRTLIVSCHHILLDGWSIALLFTELGEIYGALLSQKTLPESTLPLYSDYVDWLNQKDAKDADQFWSDYLADLHTPALLANTLFFKKHSHSLSLDYHSELFTLSHPLTIRIKAFCRKYRITFNTLFQGVWALLLARYTQTEDVLIGTTVTFRPPELTDVDRMVGLLINTLPLRVRFDGEMSTEKYFTALQQNIWSVFEYADTSLSHIQGLVHFEKQQGVHELFETVVVVENYPTQTIPALHFAFKELQITDPTHYPLVISVFIDEKLSIKFAYDANQLALDSVQRISNHFQMALLDILDNPSKPIQHINLLTKEERNQLIYEWNPPALSNISHATLQQIFEEQAKKTPAAIALQFKDLHLTYRELNERANQLAHFLLAHGVKPNTLVGICIARSFEMLIGILAILKTGAAYVPIDPTYPPARIDYILKDAAVSVLLSHSTVSKEIEQLRSFFKVLYLDRCFSQMAHVSIDNLPPGDHTAVACLIYTSGSTGNPKGVLVRHDNILNLYKNTESLFQFTAQDRLTLFHSISFDFSVWEIFGALLYGGRLIVVPRDATKDLGLFYDLLIREKVTVLNVTPGVFYKLIDLDCDKKQKNSLRYVLLSGEALARNSLIPWFERHGYKNPTLVNAYGITEATVIHTYTVLNQNPWPENVLSMIGKPFSDRAVYVLDKHRMPVPIGVIGEMYLGGGGVTHGYLNRATLTRERFIDGSFLTGVPGILYKTGDLVRRLPDGNIDYVGRSDNQVKIRGFRIELEEVQFVIEQYSTVAQAAVICHEVDRHKLLIAYVIKKRNVILEANELRDYLSEQMPAYMVPSLILFLSAFPLNANGKVDKEALQQSIDLTQIETKHHISPTTYPQKKLAEIFYKTVGIKHIGIQDNFFEMGMNSFSALEIASAIAQHFSIEIPLHVLLTHPTIAALEKELLSGLKEQQALFAATRKVMNKNSFGACLIPLQPDGKKPPLFLVHPVGGTVFWYIALARYLDADQPLYGIQDPGIELQSIPFNTIEEQAAYYINAIRSVQPVGPYYIGGASGGASISIEMAYQLEKCGEEVAFLGSFDGWGSYPDMLRSRAFFEANMYRQYHEMQHKFLAKKILKSEKLLDLQWQRSTLLADYKLPFLKSKLTLFKPTETMMVFREMDAPLNHLERYFAQPIDLHHLPGNHETMFEEPHVKQLAEKLKACLELAHSGNKTHEQIQY